MIFYAFKKSALTADFSENGFESEALQTPARVVFKPKAQKSDEAW
jgi:hypothetical protein